MMPAARAVRQTSRFSPLLLAKVLRTDTELRGPTMKPVTGAELVLARDIDGTYRMLVIVQPAAERQRRNFASNTFILRRAQ
jgi:hypothetical protein